MLGSAMDGPDRKRKADLDDPPFAEAVSEPINAPGTLARSPSTSQDSSSAAMPKVKGLDVDTLYVSRIQVNQAKKQWRSTYCAYGYINH